MGTETAPAGILQGVERFSPFPPSRSSPATARLGTLPWPRVVPGLGGALDEDLETVAFLDARDRRRRRAEDLGAGLGFRAPAEHAGDLGGAGLGALALFVLAPFQPDSVPAGISRLLDAPPVAAG